MSETRGVLFGVTICESAKYGVHSDLEKLRVSALPSPVVVCSPAQYKRPVSLYKDRVPLLDTEVLLGESEHILEASHIVENGVDQLSLIV